MPRYLAYLLGVMFMLLAGGGSALLAQSASLTALDVTATIGTSTVVPIETTHSHESDGYSFGILHRSVDLTVDSVGLGAAIIAMQGVEASVPSFFDVNLSPTLPTLAPVATGGFTVGLFFDFTLTPTATRLPIGADQELLLVTYSVALTASAGVVDLEFSGAMGSPNVEIIAALSVPTATPGQPDPVEVIPTTIDGVLTIANAPFLRGDLNDSGHYSLIDGITLLYRMFGLQAAGTCADAEDMNDDGTINLVDPLDFFSYLFAGGSPPPAPFVACGDDATPLTTLGCASSGSCP